jgi:hypothetical protein
MTMADANYVFVAGSKVRAPLLTLRRSALSVSLSLWLLSLPLLLCSWQAR